VKSQIRVAVIATLFLSTAVIPTTAQQAQTPQPPESEQTQPETEGGMMGAGMMRHGGMMGEGGMMRRGMMGQPRVMNPMMMRMIFALIDSDGDGTISLQEWQAAHEKIFKAMDPDHDGTVSFEEMMNFMRGGGATSPMHQR